MIPAAFTLVARDREDEDRAVANDSIIDRLELCRSRPALVANAPASGLRCLPCPHERFTQSVGGLLFVTAHCIDELITHVTLIHQPRCLLLNQVLLAWLCPRCGCRLDEGKLGFATVCKAGLESTAQS